VDNKMTGQKKVAVRRKVEYGRAMKRPDGKYVVQLYINGKSSGYGMATTPTGAKAAARRKLREG
jgi:hypothetical protein